MRVKVKWKQVGNECLVEFYKSVRQKSNESILSKLMDHMGQKCSEREKDDFDHISHKFYKELDQRKNISEET